MYYQKERNNKFTYSKIYFLQVCTRRYSIRSKRNKSFHFMLKAFGETIVYIYQPAQSPPIDFRNEVFLCARIVRVRRLPFYSQNFWANPVPIASKWEFNASQHFWHTFQRQPSMDSDIFRADQKSVEGFRSTPPRANFNYLPFRICWKQSYGWDASVLWSDILGRRSARTSWIKPTI